MKKMLRIFAGVMAAVLFAVCPGCNANARVEEDPLKVWLVMKYWTADYRDEIVAGARTAALEYGVQLVTQTLSFGDTPAKQSEMVQSALDNDADAIVVAAEDNEAMNKAVKNASRSGVPVVMIDYNGCSTDAVCCIDTDVEKMMEAVALSAVKMVGEEGKVFVLNSICKAGSTNDKRDALMKQLEKFEMLKTYMINFKSQDERVLKETLTQHVLNNEVKAFIALNDFSCMVCSSLIKETGATNMGLISFGSSLSVVEEMEEGRVGVMVTENAFSKGYIAVRNAVAAVKDRRVPDITLQAKLITKDTLYLPENQRLIFPLN